MNREKNIVINDSLKHLYDEKSYEFIEAWKECYDIKDNRPLKLSTFGIVDTDNYECGNGILFIGKETRGYQEDFLSWLKTLAVKNKNIDKNNKTTHPQIWYNIGRWAKFINNPNADKKALLSEKETAFEGLQKIAFTNINKVYGNSSSKTAFWKLVVKKNANNNIVADILNREIGIINPKIIVICGIGLTDTIGIKTNAILIEMPHPSSRMKKADMLDLLEKKLREQGYLSNV